MVNRRLWLVVALVGCKTDVVDVGDDGDIGDGGGSVGSGDRYSCVTTSEPGCDFSIGVGQSLIGAGECVAGTDYQVASTDTNRAQPLVLAIHAGGIEDGTGQLADLLVAELGWDAYVFRATRTSSACMETAWMHVTATRFNSATARSLAQSHPATVSLHGYSETNPARAGWPQDRWFVCVGGSHAGARAAFIASLDTSPLTIEGRTVDAFDATTAGTATSEICGGLGGTAASNIANLAPDGGLQLELPRRIRAHVAGLDGVAENATLRTRLVGAIDAAFGSP